MKHHLFLSRWQFLLIGLFYLLSGTGHAQTQLPECTSNVPFFVMDLSASPTLSYTTPEFVRQPGCCGLTSPTDDHVSFYVTLHPDVAMFELIVAPGYADPGGAGTYYIISGDLSTPGDCGMPIPGGAPVCITGSGPHKITYRKPGGNKIKYIFRQIPKPIYPDDQPTRLGCTLPLPIYGLNNISINAVAKSPNLTASLATANTYLSCTNCANPIFSPGANATYPYTITYEVTGTPQAAACGVFPTSGQFTVTVYDALNLSVSPNPGTFCAGGPGVNLTATATGGDGNYTYTWYNSSGAIVGSGNTYLAPAQGTYTAQVSDGLITATCPSEFESVAVTTANTPIVDAGPDLTACASSPTVVLNGSVQFANALWVGGDGTFSPNRSSAIATYTPTPAEIASGSVTLTLTSVNAGGGCINTSDEVTILYSSLMNINETIGNIVCNGQTTTISTAVTGGVPGYSYQWTTGSTNTSITVSAGTYGLTVTDQFSCTVTEYFTVNQPSPIELTLNSVDETVGGDGSATVSIDGGDAPYTVLWTDDAFISYGPFNLTTPPYTNTISSVDYGFYTVSVTDNNGCTVEATVVVNTFTCNGLGVNISATNVDCYGASTGSVSAVAFGGDPLENYSYSWNTTPPQNTAVVNNLPAGVYTVTVTDLETSCIDVASVAVFQPTILTNTITSSNVTVQGGNNGSATANPQGGTPGYNYSWNTTPVQTSQTATDLTAGTYTVLITDSEGCFVNDAVVINEPPCNDFLLAVNTTNVLCNGGSTGSASLFITNGTPPFSILWSTGATNVTSISGLTAGSYSVDVSDDNGCFTTKYFTITQPDPISIGLDPTNVTCFGASNGTIDLTVNGGTYPQYTYAWFQGIKNIANHEDLIFMGPGTYSVIVTDENGCTATASVGITEPAKIEGSYNYTDNLCFGQSIGSIDATISGGTLNYTYAWNGPGGYTNNTQDINGLAAGLYQLNVTDGNNCTFGPMEVYISQPTLLQASAVMTQEVSCAGGADGAANLTVTGGVMPYTYAWTGPGTFSFNGEDLINVGAGTYNVTITDFNGCSTTASVTITTTADIIDPIISCVGNQNVNTSVTSCTYTVSGTAWNATASDECFLASLTYELTGATTGTGSSLNGVAFNLGTTTVTWTATDGSGNTATCSYNVNVTDATNPSLVNCVGNQAVNTNAGVCSYTVSGTAWDATATDNCTVSSILANVTGATTATGLTTLDGFIFNLGTSTVSWTVTDGSGNIVQCIYTVTVIDNQAPSFTACVGSNQSVNADNGVCTYTVSGAAWDAIASDNCTVSTVLANVTGATTATGLTTLDGFVFNLGTSTVTWTATDASGNTQQCIFNVTVTDNQLPSFTSCVGSTQNVNVDMNECDYTVSGTAWDAVATDNCTISSVLATLTGATSASGLTTLNNVNFNVGSTTVTWTVTDGSNNTQTCTFNVVVTDNILPLFTTCGAPGNQTVNANAGICTYTHPNNSWNAAATDNCTVSSLTAALTGASTASGLSTLNGTTFNLGTTTVTWTATDIHGNSSTCSFDVLVVDNQNPIITSCGAGGNQTVIADLGECNFTQTGTAWDATATDNCSLATIIYTLSGATTGSGLSLQEVDFNLGVTTVLWTVTDGSGNVSTCTFNVTVQDTQLPAITSCGAVGNQTVPADVDVCTYTVSGTAWDASATDNCTVSSWTYTLTGATLGSGTTLDGVVFNPGSTLVTWTVLDQSGNAANCSFNVVVIDDQAPVISGCPTTINTNTDLNVCGAIVGWTIPSYTDNCGAAMTFTHTPGTMFPVGATTVVYTVTDGAGNVSTCSFNVNVTDNQLPAITCPLPIETCVPLVTYATPVASDNCAAQSVVQTGGLPSNSVFPVGITTNTFEVTDINGNLNTCSFTVEIFPVPVITLVPTNVSCFGFDNGSIDATITIGTAPYTFDWSNNATTEDISGLAPGSYTLNVIDDNGCTAIASASITQPTALQLSATDDHVNCYNGTDGAIDVTVSGGTTPYTYAWSNNADTQDISNLSAGFYSLLVTDALGCEITYATTITQPDTLLIQYQVYNATCTAASGAIQTQVTGGTMPYSYEWSNETTGLNLNNVLAGFYTFIVTDAQGCTNSITAEITSVSNIAAELTVKDLRCYNDNSGEISVFVTAGNAPFTYDWSNGNDTPNISGLAAGTYSVEITDAFGCQTIESVVVNQPDSLVITLTSPTFAGGYNVSTWNGNDGSILSEVEGGTSPYNYLWSNGETTPSISGLNAGAYSLIVTDQMGCTAYASTRLTQPDILEMPSGFSPNGDGANDYFVVHGIDAYPVNVITIYNRWGNVVYEKENYQNEWNGENKLGEPLPDATYFVVLTVEAGNEQIVLKGYVDLRR